MELLLALRCKSNQSQQMFYKFLKVLVRLVLKIFFRKIHISGLEYIDKSKPQLISSNHPSGFLEPLIMACFFPKSLHFLVRGDVFENRILKPILISTHQIPVYRFRDGFSKLRENSNSVDESIAVLLDHKNLLIFSEGGTKSIKQLRPLQKGISRIAFQSLEKNPDLNLEIIPVGINFTYSYLFNQEVMLKLGKPILLKEKFTDFQKDQKSAHENLLEEVSLGMKRNMIHLGNYERIGLLEDLFLIDRINHSKSYLPVHITGDSKLIREKSIAEKVDASNQIHYNDLTQQLSSLKSEMKIKGVLLSDLPKKPLSFLKIILLILGLIPAGLGLLSNFIPVGLAYLFTSKMVKQVEFRSSILMLSNLLLIIIYYIGVVIFFMISEINLLYILPMLAFGWFWRYYYDIFVNTSFSISKSKMAEYRKAAFEIFSKL